MNRGNSFHNLNYHLIFVTKKRDPIINENILHELRNLFYEKAVEMGFKIHIVNSYLDHVHLLISTSPRLCISNIAKHLKGQSSFSIKELYWQKGYAAFTVDKTTFKIVFQYIKKQWEHHRNLDYIKEMEFYTNSTDSFLLSPDQRF
ncbi:MAG: IS200/IS605 family transposase [Spirochaetes bacterium]|nr:IS200/IS605 family transposase [Spirochaetota bacterium]